MPNPKTTLTFLRALAFVGTVIVFAQGIWSLVIIRGIDNRGGLVLIALQSKLKNETASWSQFITTAAKGTARAWTIIVTSSIAASAILLVIMANRNYWLRIPSTILVLIELSSNIFLIIVFGCSLSLALSLNISNTHSFNTFGSADLSLFALLDPLSKALAITSSLAGIFLITTFTASIIEIQINRTQAKDIRFFEPTVSALGMSHGSHTVHPQLRTTNDVTPTTYDPFKASRNMPRRPPNTKRVMFANEGSRMSQKHSRWSASTTSMSGIERDIMKLLDVKKARRAVPVRPTRPWSEVWNGRDGAHAIRGL